MSIPLMESTLIGGDGARLFASAAAACAGNAGTAGGAAGRSGDVGIALFTASWGRMCSKYPEICTEFVRTYQKVPSRFFELADCDFDVFDASASLKGKE